MIRRKFLLPCVCMVVAGCDPVVTSGSTMQQVARVFSETCLKTAPGRGKPWWAFSSANGFSRSGLPLPGPRTRVYEGRNVIGVIQRFPNSDPPSRSCAVYADVLEVHALDDARKAQFPYAKRVPRKGLSMTREVVLGDGRQIKVILVFLGTKSQKTNPIPGNVKLTAYLDDVR